MRVRFSGNDRRRVSAHQEGKAPMHTTYVQTRADARRLAKKGRR